MTAIAYHVDYGTLPEHMQSGAEDYVERGYKPGSFLRAVLENNFVEAFGHADATNLAHMRAWAQWLWSEAPSSCWGSMAKVGAWMAARNPTPAEDDVLFAGTLGEFLDAVEAS